MKLLRAATVCVGDLDRSIETYARWLDYRLVETGALDAGLAAAWRAPASAGSRTAVLRPASGRDVFLRFVESPPHPAYVPLRSHGWAAIEICVTDVLATHERLQRSPFAVIGPPREIEGLDAIFPMQVQGPDAEIVYLTQIRGDLPDFDLPRAQAPIDSLFILVMGCSNLAASLSWLERHAGLAVGRARLDIVYTMLARAYGTPPGDLHSIATMTHGRDVFLELDQYPAAAVARPRHAGRLAPGVAVGSFAHPDFARLADGSRVAGAAVGRHPGCVYAGRAAMTLCAPDGTLVEIVDGDGLVS
jgi:hypothetical protein